MKTVNETTSQTAFHLNLLYAPIAPLSTTIEHIKYYIMHNKL